LITTVPDELEDPDELLLLLDELETLTLPDELELDELELLVPVSAPPVGGFDGAVGELPPPQLDSTKAARAAQH
jgi:hypothetical protein